MLMAIVYPLNPLHIHSIENYFGHLVVLWPLSLCLSSWNGQEGLENDLLLRELVKARPYYLVFKTSSCRLYFYFNNICFTSISQVLRVSATRYPCPSRRASGRD